MNTFFSVILAKVTNVKISYHTSIHLMRQKDWTFRLMREATYIIVASYERDKAVSPKDHEFSNRVRPRQLVFFELINCMGTNKFIRSLRTPKPWGAHLVLRSHMRFARQKNNRRDFKYFETCIKLGREFPDVRFAASSLLFR